MEQQHFSTFKTLFRFKKSLLPLAMAPIILAGCGGSDGKDGVDGIDATTEPKVVQGADGLNGADGQDGADGINGIDGQDGVNGLNGTDGQDGVNGLNGTDGQDGVNGLNGTDGQDGVNGINGTDGQDGVDGISPTPWPTPTPDPTPAPYPVTTNTINLSGGLGGADGGRGGSFELETYLLSGDIVLSDEIRTERTYTPQTFTLNFGDNPLTVTEDLPIQCDDIEPPAGEYYCFSGPNGGIFLSDGDGNYGEFDERVTGLSIAEGATLTLQSGESGNTYYGIFANDIELNGSIIVTGVFRNITLYSASYYGGGNGAIDITPSNSGRDGGTLTIQSNYVLINAASLSANGSDAVDEGSSGGEGGSITLESSTYLENSGNLSASGSNGVGPSAMGGQGGNVSLLSNQFIFNSGDIAVNGGTGGEEGGSGGEIEFDIDDNPGEIFNDGNLHLNGGNGQPGIARGLGGNGGSLSMDLNTQDLYLGGRISMTGGDGAGIDTDEGGGGHGGGGGEIGIDASSSAGNRQSIQIVLAANIDLSGGAGLDSSQEHGDGGSGGEIYMWVSGLDANVIVETSGVSLTGGHGDSGSSGGFFSIDTGWSEMDYSIIQLSDRASIEIGADIDTSGGDTLSSEILDEDDIAGQGGNISIATRAGPYRSETLSLAISGNLTANGGQGFYGQGGYIELFGYDSLAIDGDIEVNGGDASNTFWGASAGQIELASDKGPVTVNGNISLNGGDATDTGGSAGLLDMYGSSVEIFGFISADGGDADPLFQGSRGGDAGTVEAYIFDAENLPATLGTDISVEPGDGETAGGEGRIFDGLICTGNCYFGET